QPVFVWQPTPAYKYDLRYHAALSRHYGLGGHERSGVGYRLMAQAVETRDLGSNFIWLADIQEGEARPLYLDNMHYTSEFSRIIADHIADALISGNLLRRTVSAESNEYVAHSEAVGPPGDGINRLTGTAPSDYHAAKVDVEHLDELGPLSGEPV